MIDATHRRLFDRGSLPASDGGIYNPGAWRAGDGTLHLICRREVDYTWSQPVYAEHVSFTGPMTGPTGSQGEPSFTVYDTETLTLVGHHAGLRLEDHRPFVFRDQILVASLSWRKGDKNVPIKPVLSTLSGSSLIRTDDWMLPVQLALVEKNWMLVEFNGQLHTIYALDPLTIFRRDSVQAEWRLHAATPNGWAKKLGKPPRLSCHPIPWWDGYLGFWHIVLDEWYIQGAYYLDQHLQITHRTGVLLDGQMVRPSPDIYKAGVLYVSSLIEDGPRVYAFYGEGDAHTSVAIFQSEDLATALGLQ